MKNEQTAQEQQRQTNRTARTGNRPEEKVESPSWQLYVIMAIIGIGVLVLVGKVFGLF